jgi:hypothetical protein
VSGLRAWGDKAADKLVFTILSLALQQAFGGPKCLIYPTLKSYKENFAFHCRGTAMFATKKAQQAGVAWQQLGWGEEGRQSSVLLSLLNR